MTISTPILLDHILYKQTNIMRFGKTFRQLWLLATENSQTSLHMVISEHLIYN